MRNRQYGSGNISGIQRNVQQTINAPQQAGIYENPNQKGTYWQFDGTSKDPKQVWTTDNGKTWYDNFDNATRGYGAMSSPQQFNTNNQGIWNTNQSFSVNNQGINRNTMKNLQYTNMNIQGLDGQNWNFAEHSRFRNRRWVKRQNRMAYANRANLMFLNMQPGGPQNQGNGSLNTWGNNQGNDQRPKYASGPALPSQPQFTNVQQHVEFKNNPWEGKSDPYSYSGWGTTKNGGRIAQNGDQVLDWANTSYGIKDLNDFHSVMNRWGYNQNQYMGEDGKIDAKKLGKTLSGSYGFGPESIRKFHTNMTNGQYFRYQRTGDNQWTRTTDMNYTDNGPVNIHYNGGVMKYQQGGLSKFRMLYDRANAGVNHVYDNYLNRVRTNTKNAKGIAKPISAIGGGIGTLFLPYIGLGAGISNMFTNKYK